MSGEKKLKPLNAELAFYQENLKVFKIWNALYVKSRHEKKVAEYMEKHDIPCYLPLTKVLKVWSDRKKWVLEPLFKGYIFVPQNLKSTKEVIYTPGIVNYVYYNGEKAKIKAEEL